MAERVADDWFCEMMAHVGLAATCQYWARQEPDAAPGLTRYADKERALTRLLWTEKFDAGSHFEVAPGVFASILKSGGRKDDAN